MMWNASRALMPCWCPSPRQTTFYWEAEGHITNMRDAGDPLLPMLSMSGSVLASFLMVGHLCIHGRGNHYFGVMPICVTSGLL